MVRTRSLRPAVLALGVLALLAPGAGAAPRTVLASGLSSVDFAQDGGRVVVALNRSACGEDVRLVRLADMAAQVVPHRTPCPWGDGEGLYAQDDGPDIALGGRSLLATVAAQGNDLYPWLVAGGVGDPTRIVRGGPDAGVDRDLGPFIGPVVASGAVRLFATYRRTYQPPGCDPGSGDTCTLSPRSGQVRRWPGGTVVYAGSGAIIPDQMEGSRAALRDDTGAVRVITTAGAEVSSLTAAQAHARAAAVAGGTLAILRGAGRVDVRNAATGALVHAWAVPGPTIRRLDVALLHGVPWAITATRHEVSAVRLTDGHVVRLARYLRAVVTDVQIEAAGATWAWSKTTAPARSAVVFSGLPGSTLH